MNTHSATSGCDCCEGREHITPENTTNRAGLAAIQYRVGTHATLKETMLASLSEWPALDQLTTRSDDDPSIGLIDAWATVLDVLTFYQERVANEGFLGTAVESRSVRELAAALGYEPTPAVSAETYLAFEMETAAGAPSELTIEAGSKVQSLPGPGEKPQIFETIEDFKARPEWNTMAPHQSVAALPGTGATETHFEGVATGASVGDGLLFVSYEREQDPESSNWRFRRISVVELNVAAGVTRVGWKEPLEAFDETPTGVNTYMMRTNASVFGHNAPDFRLMSDSVKTSFGLLCAADWPFGLTAGDTNQLDLDRVYDDLIAQSWVVLTTPTSASLLAIDAVDEVARQDYTLVGRVSRLTTGIDSISAEFAGGVRDTSAFVQSELVAIGTVPVTLPVSDKTVVLANEVAPFADARAVMLTGRRATFEVAATAFDVVFDPEDGSTSYTLNPGDELVAQAPPVVEAGQTKWTVTTTDAMLGSVTVEPGHLRPVVAADHVELVSELAKLDGPSTVSSGRTTIKLLSAPKYAYDRSSCRVLANVAYATHGESKHDVLGSGNAAAGSQEFVLSDRPLAYLPSKDGGATSSLTVRINGQAWTGVDTLYAQGERGRVFAVHHQDDGPAAIAFGDGTEGARLPTGTENVTAEYRVGAGRDGMLAARQLSLLMSRPLGLKGVTNPLPPEGGVDGESRDGARRNAPLTVLTFDRIVSVTDYEDYARRFPGVAKVRGETLWDGSDRVVHLTIAGTDGEALGPGTTVHTNLAASVLAAGGAEQRFRIDSFEPVSFDLTVGVFIDPAFDSDVVVDQVSARLVDAYRFDNREIAQAVPLAEVSALVQGVPGVLGVDIDLLALAGELGATDVIAFGARPVAPEILPAQLLTLRASGPKVVTKS